MNVVRFYLATLGCKVNQYESHALREAWQARGWLEVDDPAKARLILVNSCAVTSRAVSDLRNTVRRLNRAAPAASIVITGCAAQVLAHEIAELPGVAGVIPQSAKDSLVRPDLFPHGVSAAASTVTAGPNASHIDLIKSAPRPDTGDAISVASEYPPFPAFSLSGYDRSRAVLKIQDGCSHGCTYCIVPLTRGKARSRQYSDSLAEAQRLLASGFREIVISGVNLRQYRQDGDKGNKEDFWDFLTSLDADLSGEWAGTARLRVSSLEPGQLTERGLDALRSCRLLCPHLHLSLQSGSPAVLRRMGRGHYRPDDMLAFLEALGRHWPVFALGADILTGFPGESEEEFAEGLRFCASLPLTYAHVFPYSRRPGTRAASMPAQIGQTVKKERSALLRDMVRDKKQAFLLRQSSLPRIDVVLEGSSGSDGGHWRGLNEYYVECLLEPPENATIQPGQLTPVTPVAVAEEDGLLRVRLIDASTATGAAEPEGGSGYV